MATYRYKRLYPGALNYPLTAIPAVLSPNKLHSPRIGNAHGLPAPTMPGDAGFECEMLEVMCVRQEVAAGSWPSAYLKKYHPRPNFDPNVIPAPILPVVPNSIPSLAVNAVGVDLPVDLVNLCIKWLNDQGAKLRAPTTGHVEFLNRKVDIYAIAANQVRVNMEKAWEVKWYYGRPRPEEVAAACGATVTNVTAYPNGSPPHPAYPGGHAAAAAAVTVLFSYYDLTPAQYEQVYDAAYHWSLYRTMAGVHYTNDNLEALRLCGFPI